MVSSVGGIGDITLTKEIDNILEKDFMITVEPGMYESGCRGFRIEDNVRVTKEGVEVLTPARK